jgi:murein DD-endopeptidase MepM/ murein hydrolase activator NlpD
MGFLTPGTILALWSFRKELKIILTALLLMVSLPVVAVILLTQVGLNVVSDKLVSVNTSTQAVQIKDPATGNIVKEIHPTVAWPVTGVVTLEFGESSFYQPLHTGIDIANPNGKIGDQIHPFMDGTVIYAGEIFWGFGKHVIIDNGNNIQSIYGHLDKIYVYPGENVTITDVVGLEGETGWATGPHLHFQINVYGIPVNPRTFLTEINL